VTAKQREALPIEERESYKWLNGYEATERAQVRLETTRLVNVCDREGDVFVLFARACQGPEQPHLLVRSVQARRIEDSDDKLWEHVRKVPSAGTPPISIPRSGKRPRREAVLELKFAEVSVLPPRTSNCTKPVGLWAVIATEIDPPAGVEPVEWLLLTTLAVTTPEEACEKVPWYAMR